MTEKIVNTEFEATLKLVAAVAAPEGLAERVKARLAADGAVPVRGRLLSWPSPRGMRAEWLRGAVAAALLAAVAVGGALAYRWVAPVPVAHKAPAIARPAAQSGFSTAGAMRTPKTLVGPLAPASKTPHHAAPEHGTAAPSHIP
jgi:hypothetical protein